MNHLCSAYRSIQIEAFHVFKVVMSWDVNVVVCRQSEEISCCYSASSAESTPTRRLFCIIFVRLRWWLNEWVTCRGWNILARKANCGFDVIRIANCIAISLLFVSRTCSLLYAEFSLPPLLYTTQRVGYRVALPLASHRHLRNAVQRAEEAHRIEKFLQCLWFILANEGSVDLSYDGKIAILTLNNVPKKNAMTYLLLFCNI